MFWRALAIDDASVANDCSRVEQWLTDALAQRGSDSQSARRFRPYASLVRCGYKGAGTPRQWVTRPDFRALVKAVTMHSAVIWFGSSQIVAESENSSLQSRTWQ